MSSDDLTIDYIQMSLDVPKHNIVCIFQEVEDWFKWPPLPATDHNMKLSVDDHGPTNSSSSYKCLPATYHTAHSVPLSFLNTPLSANPLPSISVEDSLYIRRNVSDFSAVI